MKKLLSYLIILFILQPITFNAHAKIWRINNTGIPADFTNPSLAIAANAVKNGDTLHIEPSGTSYGNFDVTKRLVIIGNGYFLGAAAANLNPNLQAYTAQSIVGNINIGTGASQTVMMGLSCGTVSIGSSVNNVVIKRNQILRIEIGATNNFQIIANYVTQYVQKIVGFGWASTNMIITNNIIIGFIALDAFDNGVFTNNVVVNNNVIGGQQFQASIGLQNFIVRNNIKVQNNQGMSFVNCNVQNNTDCTGATGFGTTNGNTGNVNMSNVFVGWPTIGSFSEDGRYALKAGSPALGTGFGGADRGAILTTTNANNNLADNYVLSGMPNVPSIFRFDAPATTSNSTMNVTISTRANQ